MTCRCGKALGIVWGNIAATTCDECYANLVIAACSIDAMWEPMNLSDSAITFGVDWASGPDHGVVDVIGPEQAQVAELERLYRLE